MKAWIFAAAIVLAACPRGAAADGHAYNLITVTGGSTLLVFLDTATMEKSPDGKISAWTLLIETAQVRSVNGKAVRYSLFQYEYDCTARQTRGISGIIYDWNKNVIASKPLTGSVPVTSNSIAETMFNAVCKQEGLSKSVFETVDAAMSFADSAVKKLAEPNVP